MCVCVCVCVCVRARCDLGAEAVGEGGAERMGDDKAAAAGEEFGGVGEDGGGIVGRGEDSVEDDGVESARLGGGGGGGGSCGGGWRGAGFVRLFGLQVLEGHVQDVALDKGGLRVALTGSGEEGRTQVDADDVALVRAPRSAEELDHGAGPGADVEAAFAGA